MSVWAFACKLESSQNRWFDGTDQDIGFSDNIVAEFEKDVTDPVSALDEQRKTLLKYVSQVRTGIGSMMFNEAQFNEFFSKLSDFDDAVFMQDDIRIDLSRSIVRINDILYPVEHFDKTISVDKSDSVDASDDTFIDYGDSVDGSDGFALDNTIVSDIAIVGLVKTIQVDPTDSVSFTESFSASIGGKSIHDIVCIDDIVSKEFNNNAGDANYAGAIGTFMFNELMFNGVGEEATITTVIGLIEEVQIILT